MNAVDLASLLCSRLCDDLMSPVGALNNGLELLAAEQRMELGWVVSDDKLPKGAVKLLLNLALLAGDALVRGGRLDVGAERRDEMLELVIRADGPRILLDPTPRE